MVTTAKQISQDKTGREVLYFDVPEKTGIVSVIGQEKPTEIFVSTNDDLLYGIEEITFSPFSTETRNELINNVKKLRALLCKNSETKFLENYFNKKINSNNSI